MSTPYFHDTPDIVIAATRWPGPVNANFTPATRPIRDAGREADRAAVSFTASGSRQRDAPESAPSLRVAVRKRVCGVAPLGKGWPLPARRALHPSLSRGNAGVKLALTGPLRRYQQTGCRKLARMVEQHLRWMESHAANPQLADACRRLSFEWRAVSRTPEVVNATPQPTVH